MSNLLISLTIGLLAAIVDIIPMIVKKLDTHFTLSAFLFWIVMGVLIPRLSLISVSWINGIAAALLVFLPLSVLIFKLDREALPAIVATTTVLGGAVGYLSSLLLK